MTEILAMATLIAPVTSGVVQMLKKSDVPKNLMPYLALVVGIGLGAAAFSFTDLIFIERLWAGGISGLAAVGLFEVGKQSTKGDDE
ncbi:holin [Alteribacter populi]|uniref:holin n=1 Tax=Alteribacter populi TaxID=2011011 RepID=UPI000BBA8673|nr:holin [Alteribacter populi]